ncbi:MAG: 16S rRNA (uracil(1498)-N(3))-methyltransferase [Peptococcaceae bacterium]|nr:16S rRNA (uracil(1498)-N(3))-methyltransferase [Peptococcaceae bacterium]
MRRFFVAPEAVQDDIVQFDAELARHMGKVLRLTAGEQVTVSTGGSTAYLVELTEFQKDAVTGRILERMENLQETAIEVVLFQGMPKGDKLELIIQKCTELGVSAVVPVETSRSVVHLDSGKAAKKLERWQKIAQEASQQSKRVQVPTVGPYYNWKQFLQHLSEQNGLTIVFWEDEQTQSLKALLRSQAEKPQRINLVVGPEGGLSEEEVEQLRALGAVSASLGKRILRTETAGMAGISMVMYEFDELE